jgi:hypothetical protein
MFLSMSASAVSVQSAQVVRELWKSCTSINLLYNDSVVIHNC